MPKGIYPRGVEAQAAKRSHNLPNPPQGCMHNGFRPCTSYCPFDDDCHLEAKWVINGGRPGNPRLVRGK